jgi:hypothetical protein
VNFAFKLFRREILDHMTLESEGSFIDAELLIEASRSGYRINEYGLNYFPRIAGVSTLSGLNIIFKILSEMRGYIRRAGLARKLERGLAETPAEVLAPDIHGPAPSPVLQAAGKDYGRKPVTSMQYRPRS